MDEKPSNMVRIEVVECEGGGASVCAIIGDEIREDPGNADVPAGQAMAAARAYADVSDPLAAVDLARMARMWPLVGFCGAV